MTYTDITDPSGRRRRVPYPGNPPHPGSAGGAKSSAAPTLPGFSLPAPAPSFLQPGGGMNVPLPSVSGNSTDDILYRKRPPIAGSPEDPRRLWRLQQVAQQDPAGLDTARMILGRGDAMDTLRSLLNTGPRGSAESMGLPSSDEDMQEIRANDLLNPVNYLGTNAIALSAAKRAVNQKQPGALVRPPASYAPAIRQQYPANRPEPTMGGGDPNLPRFNDIRDSTLGLLSAPVLSAAPSLLGTMATGLIPEAAAGASLPNAIGLGLLRTGVGAGVANLAAYDQDALLHRYAPETAHRIDQATAAAQKASPILYTAASNMGGLATSKIGSVPFTSDLRGRVINGAGTVLGNDAYKRITGQPVTAGDQAMDFGANFLLGGGGTRFGDHLSGKGDVHNPTDVAATEMIRRSLGSVDPRRLVFDPNRERGEGDRNHLSVPSNPGTPVSPMDSVISANEALLKRAGTSTASSTGATPMESRASSANRGGPSPYDVEPKPLWSPKMAGASQPSVDRVSYADAFKQALIRYPGVDPRSAGVQGDFADTAARRWSADTGRPEAEWWQANIDRLMASSSIPAVPYALPNQSPLYRGTRRPSTPIPSPFSVPSAFGVSPDFLSTLSAPGSRSF